MGKNNISFSIDKFDRNKILNEEETISSKIFFILNARDSLFGNSEELPKLMENFNISYKEKTEIENMILDELTKFLEPSIVIKYVLYRPKDSILAIFINNQELPFLFSISQNKINKLEEI